MSGQRRRLPQPLTHRATWPPVPPCARAQLAAKQRELVLVRAEVDSILGLQLAADLQASQGGSKVKRGTPGHQPDLACRAPAVLFM